MADEGSVKIRITGDDSDFKTKLKNLAGGALKGLTASIGAAATAMAALGAAAVKVGSEFESAFAQTATIMDTSVVSVGTMRGEIIKLSNDMGVAASELSGTVYNAISATGDTAGAVGLVADATKLATAGFTDTGSALSVLTTTLNAYGMATENAAAISDSLITVQNLGVTTVSELAASMGKAIATASAYNVNLGNVESAYVSLTKAGINTAEGTTYLSSMLNELGDAGSDVSDVLKKKTGKSFSELMSSGASLGDVLSELYEACDNDATALMNLWGSAEAGKASNAIVSQGLEQFNKNLETIQNSAGTTEKAYATMADTLEHKTDTLKENIKNLGIEIYDGMEAPLKSAADSALSWVWDISDAFSTGGLSGAVAEFGSVLGKAVTYAAELAPEMASAATKLIDAFVDGVYKNRKKIINAAGKTIKAFSDGLGDLVPILKPVTKLISNLAEHLDDLLPTVKGLVTAIVAFKAAMAISKLISGVTKAVTAFKAANEAATLSQAALNAAMNLNPAAVAAAGIAALAGSIVMFTSAAKKAEEDMRALSEAQQAAVDAAMELADAQEQTAATATENANAAKMQMEHTQQLTAELMSLADEDGRVLESEQARAQYILGELNSALGTEYTMTDGLIGNYAELESQVYSLIEAKKAEVMLQAYEEQYAEAIKNTGAAEENRAALALSCFNQRKEIAEMESAINELQMQKLEARDAYEEGYYQRQIENAQMELDAKRGNLEELSAAYEESRQTAETYYNNINNYETASALAMAGYTDEAIAILEEFGLSHNDATAVIQQAHEEQLSDLKQNVIDSESEYQELQDEYARTQSEMTAEQKEQMEQRIADAKKAADDAMEAYYEAGGNMIDGMVSGVKDGQWRLNSALVSAVNSAVAAAKRAMDSNSPSKRFRKLFRYVPQGAALGIKDDTPLIADASEEMVDTIEKELNSLRPDITLDPQYLKRMQAAVEAETAYMAVPAARSAEADGGRYISSGEGQTVNNYNMTSTYNSPNAMSWRDIKLYQETQKQQMELLGL